MPQDQWTSVDQYINNLLTPSDAALENALTAASDAGLPPINVAPNQGKLLHLLAKISKAQRILEIGTLGGYSTIWLARALPNNGKLITLEFDPKHAEVAKSNIHLAGFSDIVEIRVGPALETLPQIEAEGKGPFDFIFMDADKANNANYLVWALKLSHVGTIIICDNVIRNGSLVDNNDNSPDLIGTRNFFEAVSAEPRLSATAIQTVGSKGYDGFALAVVVA